MTDAARALHAEAKLVRSTNVPREVWVVRVVLSKGVEFLLSLPVLFLFAFIYGAPVDWQLVLLIPAVLLMATLVLGVGLLLAPLVVLVRDLERIVRIALRLGFYASPVIFAVQDVPEPWDAVFAVQPAGRDLRTVPCGLLPRHGQLGTRGPLRGCFSWGCSSSAGASSRGWNAPSSRRSDR